MLERLSVRSLGIIDAVELEPDPGFVVLTGETGAGKSLLVESLKLLAGQRATSELVRSGEERLVVEGVFRIDRTPALREPLAELGVEHDGWLTIRRELTAEGRGRAWLNDLSVTAGALQRIAPHLLAIHGQHEQYGLADPETQCRLVDEYGSHAEHLGRVAAAFAEWQEIEDERRRLEEARARRRDRLDAIAFQIAEIDAVAPRADEDDALRERRQVLRHAVRLLELSGSVLERLGEGERVGVVDELARAGREVEEMAECGLPLEGAAARLAEARMAAEEVLREVQDLATAIEQDPAELDAVETRLARLDQLMLKYGSPLARVLEHRETLAEERDALTGVEERLGDVERAAREALEAYAKEAEALDAARAEAGKRLLDAVQEVLGRLSMAGTRLELWWQPRAEPSSPLERDGVRVAFSASGVAVPELRIAPNPGEELRPMARIASGGELSRLHLALRTALRARHGGERLTLLFDEVDSGLGGATAAALARLLADLAAADQVLVVTHLPQVAAAADCHFRVEKVEREGRAVTRVKRLSPAGREEEVARMLAGQRLGESALAHARSLLEST